APRRGRRARDPPARTVCAARDGPTNRRPPHRARRARHPRAAVSAMGLGNPAGALGLIAVAILVALYLWDRRRHVVPVATMFLWRQIPPQTLERRRFRPDLLFWVQLAA